MIIDFNKYNGGSASGVTPEQVQEQITSALTPYWDSGETVDYVDEAISGITPSDPTRLLSVEELPTSAETGTVMALSAEDVAYWDLSGDIALFKPANGFCFEETPGLEKITATTLIATFTEPYYPGPVSVYYENGILHFWDPGGEGIGYITPGQAIYFRTGYPDAPFIWFYCQNANELQVYVGKDWHEYTSGWTAIPDFVPYNIASNVVGLYQYDGQNWNEVGGADLSAYWTSAETKDYVDSAVSGIDLSNYYTKSETDSAITAVEDHLYDVEEVTASALTELHTGLLEVSARTVDLSGYYTSGETDAAISAATSGKADAANIQPNLFDYRLPSWNEQGIVTGALGNAYTNSITINGVSKSYWGRGNGNPDPFYAPLSAGSAGEILVSKGSGAPVWSAMPAGDVTKAYVDSAVTDLQNQVDTMDEVVSTALVDLNERVDEISGNTGGGTDLSNYWNSAQTENAISVATQDMVTSTDIRHIVKLTQSEYDNLSVKDPQTFYIIVNNN